MGDHKKLKSEYWRDIERHAVASVREIQANGRSFERCLQVHLESLDVLRSAEENLLSLGESGSSEKVERIRSEMQRLTKRVRAIWSRITFLRWLQKDDLALVEMARRESRKNGLTPRSEQLYKWYRHSIFSLVWPVIGTVGMDALFNWCVAPILIRFYGSASATADPMAHVFAAGVVCGIFALIIGSFIGMMLHVSICDYLQEQYEIVGLRRLVGSRISLGDSLPQNAR